MSIRKRCVFYLSGFDPSGPSHYHRMYREQAALQSKVTGDRVEVGPRKKRSEHVAQWDIAFTPAAGGETVRTDYRFWRWDDIIRDHWPRQRWRTAFDSVRSLFFNLRTGASWRMVTMCWPPWLALNGPGLLVLAVVIGSPLLALALASALHAMTGSWWFATIAAVIPVAAVLIGRRLEMSMHMHWLAHSFSFTRLQALDRAPTLEARLDGFARELVATVNDDDFDEVQLIGHSSGSIMAISALARALMLDPTLPARGPRITLLMLGHCTPMLSSLPQAQRFRDELALIGRTDGIDWLDIGAPPDGCTFIGCEPLESAGLPKATRPDHPKMISPMFHTLFTPAGYAQVRADRFRLHFQYVMASERAGLYDFFALSAGPQTVAERFAAQQSVTDYQPYRLFGR